MVETVSGFVDAIRQGKLLLPEQIEELGREQARFPDARGLARHLLQKGWLTPYQVNQVLQGRAAGLVLGSYVLMERIGEGGMGQVFKARHRRLDRTVALKVIRKEHLQNRDAVIRFEREIRVVASLSHPNVVAAYDADESADSSHFFVMEYVDGDPLGHLVKKHGPPPVPVACDYAKQVALGLQHAFERGMVHRDIKPSNLLVTRPEKGTLGAWGSTVKILDMGVARFANPVDDDSISALTKEGKVVGTPDYMAPEQAVNSAKADIRADLYSLGCTFYQLLAGHPPYAGGTPMEKLLKHRIDQPKPIEQLRPEVSPALAAILRKMMAKKPEDRYQTPSEVAAALDGLRVPAGAPARAAQAAAYVPMALPVSASGRHRHVPMAEPVTDNHGQGSTSWNLSWSTLTKGKGPWGLPWPVLIGAFLIILLGFTFLLVAMLSLGRGRRTQNSAPEALTLALREIVAQPRSTPEEEAAVRRELLRFARQYGGAPQAVDAARQATRLSSPLDVLQAGAIPPAERHPQLPAEVVKVLGERRQRHWGVVRSVAMSPDGSLVASGGDDQMVRLWDASTMEERAALAGHEGAVHWLAFVSGGQVLASAATDGSLRFWEDLGKQPRARPEVLAECNGQGAVAFSPDGLNLAYVTGPSTIRLLDLREFRKGGKPAVRGNLTGPHTAAVRTLAFSPDGKLLASGGADNRLVLWDIAAAKAGPKGQQVHASAVQALAFSRDGKLLASGEQGGPVRIWNVGPGAVLQPAGQFRAHEGAVMAVAFTPDGGRLVSAGADLETRVWSFQGQQTVLLTERPTQWINALAFAGKEPFLASAGQDTTVRLWDLSSAPPRERHPLQEPAGPTGAVAFLPDSTILAVAHDGERAFRLHDLVAGRTATYFGDNGWGFWLAFAPDGEALASAGCFAERIQLWDLGPGKRPPADLSGASRRVRALAFSPAGKLLASAGDDAVVRLWTATLARPKELRGLVGHRGPVTALAFSPDSRLLASAGDDGTIRLWNVLEGQALHVIKDQHARALAFSPDGKSLAVAGADGERRGVVRLFDLADPPQLRDVAFRRGHNRPITGLAFTPDGEGLLSAGDDGQIILHGPSSGQVLSSWRLPGAIRGISLAVDGRHLATANANGTAYVLRIKPVPPKS